MEWALIGWAFTTAVAVIALVLALCNHEDIRNGEKHSDDRDSRMADMAGHVHILRLRGTPGSQVGGYADVIEDRLAYRRAGRIHPREDLWHSKRPR